MSDVRYLDLDLLINGGMDAFLLVLTARILKLKVYPKRILGGVLLGEIPVLLAVFSVPVLSNLCKFIVPIMMIKVAFQIKGFRSLLKTLVGFWLLSAGLGGFIYAIWGWSTIDDSTSAKIIKIGMENIWILPLAAAIWWGIQFLWQSWQTQSLSLAQSIYDVEIDFGEGGAVISIKALIDTGNQLEDPLTGNPVIMVEEEVATKAISAESRAFLSSQSMISADNPWSSLWNTDPSLMKELVFIPFQTIERKSWLLGIRPKKVKIFAGSWREIPATIALVKQVLSPAGDYQGLLHPEHIRKGGVNA